MKKSIFLIGLVLLFFGCANPKECIESTGTIITREIPVADFDKIIVHQGVGLVVTEGPNFNVEVKTGEN